MIDDGRSLEFGIVEVNGSVKQVPGELYALSEVPLDELIGAARAECPEANCCLDGIKSAYVFEAPGWVDDRPNPTYICVDSVVIGCPKNERGCQPRAERLKGALLRSVEIVQQGNSLANMADADAKRAFDPGIQEIRAKISALEASLQETLEAATAAGLESREKVNIRTRRLLAIQVAKLRAVSAETK